MTNLTTAESIDGIGITDLVAAKIIPAGTPAAQIQIFAAFCREMGLSAIKKECYLVANPRYDGSVEYFNITSIAGARKPAHASGVYLGKSEVMFDLKSDGSFKRMAELNAMPKTATIIIYKNVCGFKAEFPATIMVSEYLKQTEKKRSTHDKMPYTMICKTVEMHALRSAFSELNGVYIEEELPAIKGETEHAHNTIVIKPSNQTVPVDKVKELLNRESPKWEEAVKYMSTAKGKIQNVLNKYEISETDIKYLEILNADVTA